MDADGNQFDAEVIPDKIACLAGNHSWVNSYVNFDHVGKAYLALFQVSTFKGWTAVLKDAVDSRDEVSIFHKVRIISLPLLMVNPIFSVGSTTDS